MNKHTKLGIIIAPFLAIGGYVAADYYTLNQQEKQRYHKLHLQSNCDLSTAACVLKGGGLELSLSDNNGITQIQSNHPLTSAAIAMVNNNKEKPNNLKAGSNKTLWTIATTAYAKKGNTPYRLRIAITANDHIFFSEFDTLPLF